METSFTRLVLVLSIGAMVPLVSGCDDENSPVLGGGQPLFGAQLVLRDAKGEASTEFATGEPVTFELTIGNLTTDPQRIVFPDSQTHEFEIRDPAGARLWNWAHDQNFAAVLTPVNFLPGESKVFSVTWDQTDNAGERIATGDYDASGFLPVDLAGVRAETVRLAILP